MDENKELEKAAEEHGWEPVEPGSVQFPEGEDDGRVVPEVKKPQAREGAEHAPAVPTERSRPRENLLADRDGLEASSPGDGDQEEAVERIEEDRKQHDEAVKELMKDIRELRERAKRRKLEKDELQAEADTLVSRFLETSDGKMLKKILPDRAHAKTGLEKLAEVVAIGLKLRAWDNAAFMVRYNQRFGSDVEAAFKKREKAVQQNNPL